MHLRIYSAKR